MVLNELRMRAVMFWCSVRWRAFEKKSLNWCWQIVFVSLHISSFLFAHFLFWDFQPWTSKRHEHESNPRTCFIYKFEECLISQRVSVCQCTDVHQPIFWHMVSHINMGHADSVEVEVKVEEWGLMFVLLGLTSLWTNYELIELMN